MSLEATGALSTQRIKDMQDEMWTGATKKERNEKGYKYTGGGDRETVIRSGFMRHTSGYLVKSDATFHVVRLLKGVNCCCYVIMNARGLICFIGCVPTEGIKHTLLAHVLVSERNTRRSLPQPTGGVTDVCCHDSDRHQSAGMQAYGYPTPEKIDCFHGMQRLLKTLVSPNKLFVKSYRAALVRRFHDIIWKTRKPMMEVVDVYQQHLNRTSAQLYELKNIDITTRCEMSLMNDLLRDTKHKGELITTALEAITCIRNDVNNQKAFVPYVIDQRNTIEEQLRLCDAAIHLIQQFKL